MVVWPRTCRCAQQHAVGNALVPQHKFSIWGNKATLLQTDGLWQPIAFVKYPHTLPDSQVPWPSHFMSLQLMQHSVYSAFFLFAYFSFFFFFPLTDGQKRKKSLRKKLDSLGKEKNRDKGKIKWVQIYWSGLSFAYKISLVLNVQKFPKWENVTELMYCLDTYF